MFHQRLRQQRLESEADSKWLQQEEQNIELPFSPVRNKLFSGFRLWLVVFSTKGINNCDRGIGLSATRVQCRGCLLTSQGSSRKSFEVFGADVY